MITPKDRQRFWRKVNFDGPLFQDLPCWIWRGSMHKDGYGHIKIKGKMLLAHRIAWMLTRYAGLDSFPKGLELDHLCRVRECVNPLHMELVTHSENILRGNSPQAINARKLQCKRGHPLSGDNLKELPSRKANHRICKTCYEARYQL